MSKHTLNHGLKIYNTLTKQKEDFHPIEPGKITLYVCGITIYDDCHIGHARVFVAFDMVIRFLKMMGWQIKYVRNITDIDDKIIQRAAQNNESVQALTSRYIEEMDKDTQLLGIIKPDLEPRATQYIAQMISLIQNLINQDIAYIGQSGDVYFSVEKFPAYGELAHKDLDKLQSGARVEIELAKNSPLDFVLWKQSKDNEPAWESPWGAGRPGWHIECSAMVMDCLGSTIDIHGGGADLKFPHHENERAQSQAVSNQTFVNTWMHVGFVQTDKEKMSKSLNNFFTIKEVLKQYNGEVIRYFLLASHYRSPVNYSQEQLILAHNALTTLYTALRGIDIIPPLEINLENRYQQAFISAMSDDFNTPEALVVLFELARDLNVAKIDKRSENQALIQEIASTLKMLANSLGFLERSPELFLQGSQDTHANAEIDALIAQRVSAREAKDWVKADEIRKMLDAKEIIIEDTPEGTLWRRK